MDRSQIPFTQFLLPNGKRTQITFDASSLSEDFLDIAWKVIDCGVKYEIEMLRSGQISMEAMYGDDECLAGEICENGPIVVTCVEKMILDAEQALRAKGVLD